MNIAALVLYACITTFTPGPNNIMSMSIAGQKGFRRAFRYCLGVFIGVFSLMLLAAAFSALLESLVPKMALAMKIIGAAYILYLAFVILRDKPHRGKEGGKRRLNPDSVLTGTILQFVNPKGILYSITSMSVWVLPYVSSVYVTVAFGAMLAFIALISGCCWALCGSVFEKIFSRYKKILNIIMAMLLVYCAVSLFL